MKPIGWMTGTVLLLLMATVLLLPRLGRLSSGALYAISDRGGTRQLYALDPDQQIAVRLNEKPVVPGGYLRSPDGQTLLLGAPNNRFNLEDYSTFRLAWHGGAAQPITVPDMHDWAWSADSQQIAFSSRYLNEYRQIFIIQPDGAGLRQLTREGENVNPSWSPDGRQIVFVSNRGGGAYRLYVLDATCPDVAACERSTRRLTQNPPGWDHFRPRWTPAGDQIIFVESNGFINKLQIIQTDGRRQRSMTNNAGASAFPIWSPDGRWIAYLSDRSGTWAIYVVDAACVADQCSSDQPLNRQPAHVFSITWLPDSQALAYVTNISEHPALWVVSLTGEERRLMSGEDAYWSPAWWPE